MEQLLELVFGGSSPFSLLLPDLLEFDQEFPKSELFALYLLHRRNQASMSQLAADLGAPLSTVTGIVARLERKQLVVRQRDPDDRRTFLVELTPSGHEIASRLQANLASVFMRIQTALSPDEMSQLLSLAQKIFKALQAKPLLEKALPVDDPQPKKIIIEN